MRKKYVLTKKIPTLLLRDKEINSIKKREEEIQFGW